MAKGGYIDQDKVAEVRRAAKAAKAKGAGKHKSEEVKRFSLAREDRYIRPEANLEGVSEMFPVLSNEGCNDQSLFSFYAAKPEQVSREKVCEFLDTAPLLCEEAVDMKWIARFWPSVSQTCALMSIGDVQHWSREIQTPERIWKTTLYVKRRC